ncbi:MAG: hypothetical protein ACFE0P_02180 [Oceanicaulis sp.]
MLLGLVHAGLAFTQDRFTLDLLWFVGSGLAIICVALGNLLQATPVSVGAGVGLCLQNAILIGFFIAAWFLMPQPQVVGGGALFAGLFLLSALRLIRMRAALDGPAP